MGLEGKWDLGQKKGELSLYGRQGAHNNNNDIRNTKLFNLSMGPRRQVLLVTLFCEELEAQTNILQLFGSKIPSTFKNY